MTRPQNRHLKSWPKGTSGNPSGRKRIPDELRDVKILGRDELRRLIQKTADKTPNELKQLIKGEETPVLELMLASVIMRAIQEGDSAKLTFLLDRLVGKVSDKHENEVVSVKYVTEIARDGSLIRKIWEEESTRKD